MASAIAITWIGSLIGCRLTGVEITDLQARAVAALLITAAYLPLPLYLHRKWNVALRDSSLCVYWAALFWIVLPFPVDIAARLGRAFPLRDGYLARWDVLAGVDVTDAVHWASGNPAGQVLNACYALLTPLLVVAFLVPGFTGRVLAAKRVLVANLAAFAIGLPIFALVPAVGPWVLLHISPRPDQLACQATVEQIRAAEIYAHRPAGIICFPSFHVMWAILSAAALWPVRWLRVPAMVVALAIIASTMTTGWHYFSDVVAGLLLAAAAMGVARLLIPR